MVGAVVGISIVAAGIATEVSGKTDPEMRL